MTTQWMKWGTLCSDKPNRVCSSLALNQVARAPILKQIWEDWCSVASLCFLVFILQEKTTKKQPQWHRSFKKIESLETGKFLSSNWSPFRKYG